MLARATVLTSETGAKRSRPFRKHTVAERPAGFTCSSRPRGKNEHGLTVLLREPEAR